MTTDFSSGWFTVTFFKIKHQMDKQKSQQFGDARTSNSSALTTILLLIWVGLLGPGPEAGQLGHIAPPACPGSSPGGSFWFQYPGKPHRGVQEAS